jgi:recombination protein RecA
VIRVAVLPAQVLHHVAPLQDGWAFEALSGRVVQLDGAADSAALTLAFTVVLEAQQRGEPAVWIAAQPSVFYPPDAYDCGVDLAALPVVRVSDVTASFSAADLLLRSGAFGLLVADLGVPPAVPSTALARLAGLARKHRTALLLLTGGPKGAGGLASSAAGSLGSLISMHAHAERRRLGPDRFGCGLVAVKDKSRAPAWRHVELRRGSAGLR